MQFALFGRSRSVVAVPEPSCPAHQLISCDGLPAVVAVALQLSLHCNSDAGTFLIGQEERQQCMSGPIFTECARTARKRTIGALVFLKLSENLEENLDNKLHWATLPHETTEKGRIS